MDEKRIEETSSVSLKNVLIAIKNNAMMIVLIVVLSAMCGLLYSYIVKPYYTATESVIYIATDDSSEEDTATDINIMRGFFNTVVDFCTTGVVVDRANFYYVDFMNEKDKDPYLTIDEYIARINVGGDDPYSTSSSDITGQKYVLKEKIVTQLSNAKDSADQFSFTISYVDGNYDESIYKVKLVVLAINREIHSDGLEYQGKYFSGIDNQVMALGLSSVTSSVSKPMCLLIGGLIGIIIAVCVIYLMHVLDNTVRTKKMIEQLTGVNVLAVLEKDRGEA